MKKLSLVLLLCSLFCFPYQAISQSTPSPCGLTHQDQLLLTKRLLKNKEALKNGVATQRGAITYVAVRFILVADTDGDNRTSPQKALQMLCLLNDFYADQDIVFYLKEMNFDLNFTGVNDDPGGNTSVQNIIPGFLDDKYDALNIFITRKIDNDASSSGVLGYYLGPSPVSPGQFPNDYIVMKESRMLDPLVAVHEVGHFFSLLHPFFGWDGDNGWNPAIHGNPAPATSPLGVPTELVSGANCNNAGDFICDTPPDYQFGFGWPTGDCEYTDGPNNHPNAGALDPNGVPVDPQELNVMSYFFGCNGYLFTNQQKNIIAQDLASNNRNYIRPNYTPSGGPITGTAELLSPEDGATTNAYNQVVLEWEAVPGATHYLLEVDRLTSFTVEPQYYIVSSTSFLLVDKLEPERKYYWRVTPFSEANTCGETTDEFDFTTGVSVATQEIAAVKRLAVFPNPTTTSKGFTVSIESNEQFTANINVTSITGQIVTQQINQQIPTGQSNFNIDTNDLVPGVYILSIQSDKGTMNKRIFISQ